MLVLSKKRNISRSIILLSYVIFIDPKVKEINNFHIIFVDIYNKNHSVNTDEFIFANSHNAKVFAKVRI